MASRLAHAIVVTGIALGGNLGCGGAGAADDAASDAADAQADVADAGSAPVEAFCDAGWPPTKSNALPRICNSAAGCENAGPAPTCMQEIAPHDCSSTAIWGTWCVNGSWECSAGAVPSSECQCQDMPADAGCP